MFPEEILLEEKRLTEEHSKENENALVTYF